MSYIFIIPAYEPDVRIVSLIRQLLENSQAHICIVNDGSQNAFPFKNSIFQDKRVSLLYHAINLGKGASLKTAFNYVLTHFPHIKAVVTLDADGQHAIQDVLKIAKKTQTHQALILGTRSFALSGQEIPLKSRLGNIITRLVWRLIMGSKITDTQTGLRGIPSSLMKASLHILPNRYEFEMEMLLKAAELNIPFVEVPVETIYIDQNRGSHFNPLLDSLKIYFVLLRYSFSALLSTAVDYMAFYISLTFFSIGLSFIFVRLISFFVNYNLNKSLVFRKKRAGVASLLKYLTLFCSNLYIGYFSLEYTSFEGFPTIYSKVGIDIVLFFFNFFAQREWVFKSSQIENS